MNHRKMHSKLGLPLLIACLFLRLSGMESVWAQNGGEVAWIRVGSLQSFWSEQGSEVESCRTNTGTSEEGWLMWPAEYGMYLSSARAMAMWIGCRDFDDPVAKKVFPFKVVGVGPRSDVNRPGQIFELPGGLKLIGKNEHPVVIVDGEIASELTLYDELKGTDDKMKCDRMIVNTINSSVGITMTRKIMGFSQQNHDSYFIYDYVFKNTGIIDKTGTLASQTLKDVWFYFQYRYSLQGESVTAYQKGWGAWATSWGKNIVNQVIGQDPTSPNFIMRALYAWYGPHSERTVSDDWGCPNEKADLENGIPDESLGAGHYAGTVTLYADKSVNEKVDDPYQPKSTQYTGSDATIVQQYSQYDAQLMQTRYEHISGGHPKKTHAEEVGTGFADLWTSDAGGIAQGQSFGPYATMAPGDSVHIVVAVGVGGLSREKNREVATNWLKWTKGVASKPKLILPNGSETTNFDAYKDEWVWTMEDSVLQTLKNAVSNYQRNYDIPQPPPAPNVFEIKSGGDRIRLIWANNAESATHFNGYQIYRSKGTVMKETTVYEKIFECTKANLVNTYDDTTAKRGFDYYYYVQSKDDGTLNDVRPGVPLVSSKFYTMTNKPANLKRPAGKALEEIRVVPNPYVISKRAFQFGANSQYDRIVFYGLPPVCIIRIYTERGDLVWSVNHDDGSGDEFWDSLTSSRQIVTSGLYIAYFETPDGKSIIRKFIIIR